MAKMTRRTVSAKVASATAQPAPNTRTAAKAASVPAGWLLWGTKMYSTAGNTFAFGSGPAAIPHLSVLGCALIPNRADADAAIAKWRKSAMSLGGGLNPGIVTADPTGIQGYTSGPSGFPVVHPPTVPQRIDSPPVEAPTGRWFIWTGNLYMPEVAALSRGAAGVVPWGNVATFLERADAAAFQSQHNWLGYITQDWSGTRDKPPVAG